MAKKEQSPDIADCKWCGRQYYKKGGNSSRQRICWLCLNEKIKESRRLASEIGP